MFSRLQYSQPSNNELWESYAFRDSDVSAWSEACAVCDRVEAIAIVCLVGTADAVAGLQIPFTGSVGSVHLSHFRNERDFADEKQVFHCEEAKQRGEYLEAHDDYTALS